jgi:hypothetical protein
VLDTAFVHYVLHGVGLGELSRVVVVLFPACVMDSFALWKLGSKAILVSCCVTSRGC